MAAASDDLGRVARERGIEGHDSMLTCLHVPGCKKKVYEEDGVEISFHKYPEDKELFRKWIVDRSYEGLLKTL